MLMTVTGLYENTASGDPCNELNKVLCSRQFIHVNGNRTYNAIDRFAEYHRYDPMNDHK